MSTIADIAAMVNYPVLKKGQPTLEIETLSMVYIIGKWCNTADILTKAIEFQAGPRWHTGIKLIGELLVNDNLLSHTWVEAEESRDSDLYRKALFFRISNKGKDLLKDKYMNPVDLLNPSKLIRLTSETLHKEFGAV